MDILIDWETAIQASVWQEHGETDTWPDQREASDSGRERPSRRDKYHRLRSRAREHYLQICGYGPLDKPLRHRSLPNRASPMPSPKKPVKANGKRVKCRSIKAPEKLSNYVYAPDVRVHTDAIRKPNMDKETRLAKGEPDVKCVPVMMVQNMFCDRTQTRVPALDRTQTRGPALDSTNVLHLNDTDHPYFPSSNNIPTSYNANFPPQNDSDHSYFSSSHTIPTSYSATILPHNDLNHNHSYLKSIKSEPASAAVCVQDTTEALLTYMKQTIYQYKHQIMQMSKVIGYTEPRMFGPRMLKDDQSTMWWTGIPKKDMFEGLFDRLKPKVEKHKIYGKITDAADVVCRDLPLMDEYFGVLVRLKLGMPSAVVSHHLGISEDDFLMIFRKWLSHLREELESITLCQRPQQVELVAEDGQSVTVEVKEEPTQLHVNHADGRIKYFRILDEVMPWSIDIIRDVVKVCDCLSNFHIPVNNNSVL